MNEKTGKVYLLEDEKRRRLAKATPVEVLLREAMSTLGPAERQQLTAHIRVCVGAAFGESDRRQSMLQRVTAPTLPHFDGPIDLDGFLFSDLSDLKKGVGDELWGRFFERVEQAQLASLDAYEKWRPRTYEAVQTLDRAREAGVEPGQILSVPDLRSALAVRRVFHDLAQVIPGARQQITKIMLDLDRQSPEGVVKGLPLAKAMMDLNGLCHGISGNLNEMSRCAGKIAGSTRDGRAREISSRMDALMEQARTVFSPFTSGARIVTASQLNSLRNLIGSAQTYYDDTGYLISQANRQILYYRAIGDHAKASEIEEALRLQAHFGDFKRAVASLNQSLLVHYTVIAAEGIRSGALLKSVPPSALTQAKSESGLLEQERLARLTRHEELVIPASNDLELR